MFQISSILAISISRATTITDEKKPYNVVPINILSLMKYRLITFQSRSQYQLEDIVSHQRFFQIDVVKSIAISFVLIDHMLPWEMLDAIGAQFWERLAMPFFLVIMGFNMGHSFKHKGVTRLRDLYSREYFWKKTKRYVLPFILTYFISFLLGIYFDALEFGEDWYLLWLPFWGPGNWFILVLFTSILVFPIIYKAYTIKPKLTVALCVLSEILVGLILFFNAPLLPYEAGFYVIEEARDLMWFLRLNILIYLSAVGLGLWFSDGHDIKERRNWFLWVAAPLSFIIVCMYYFYDFRLQFFDGEYYRRIFWGDYTILIYPYAAFLILLAMRFIPSESDSRIASLISRISKSTYHILLCQILYYAVWFHLNPEYIINGFGSDVYLYIPFYIFTVFVCFSCGMLWFEAERRIGVAILRRKEKETPRASDE